MKGGPRHLPTAREGGLEGNLRSWKEFENAATRKETGQVTSAGLRQPRREVCGRGGPLCRIPGPT